MKADLAIGILLATWFGYAAQRGSLCAVSAIADVIDHRSSKVFLSFFYCSAWVAVVTLPSCWLFSRAQIGSTFPLRASVLAGGFLFGVGAAVNGGCSFGSLARLASGDISFLASFVGMHFGIQAEQNSNRFGAVALPDGPSMLADPSLFSIGILASAATLCLASVALSGKSRDTIGWPPERAAMIMGLTGGALYLISGDWAPGRTWVRIATFDDTMSASPVLPTLFLVAILFGATFGAIRARAFRLRAEWPMLPMRLAGGLLMGVGIALVPGGNGALILHALPALSPHAPAAYAALTFGAATMLCTSTFLRRRARLLPPGSR